MESLRPARRLQAFQKEVNSQRQVRAGPDLLGHWARVAVRMTRVVRTIPPGFAFDVAHGRASTSPVPGLHFIISAAVTVRDILLAPYVPLAFRCPPAGTRAQPGAWSPPATRPALFGEGKA